MAFAVGDLVAHPLHGAGVVDSIEKEKRGGVVREYYVMRVGPGDMLVKIPTDTSDAVGVRPIVSAERADEILESVASLKISMTQNWNKRYRENMLRLKSGDLMEVAAVVKGLTERESGRGLSTGERKMLNSAKQILLSELVLSKHQSYDELSARLENALS